MRVLFWTPIFWPDVGGIERISLEHIACLQERNHEFVVLTARGRLETPDQLQIHGVPVYRFPVTEAFETRNLRLMMEIQKQMTGIITAFRPDMVHLNFGGPTPIGYFYLKTAGRHPAPLVVALHESVAGLKSTPDTILGKIFDKAGRITACSTNMLEDACSISKSIAGRASTVYYGLPAPEILLKPLPVDDPHVLCLGRLVHNKGFDVALNAFASLKDRYPQARFSFVGDGPERSSLERLSRGLKLDRVVHFAGEVAPANVYDAINESTMVVVPSRYREAFGLVSLEAAQMARPVVATRVGGLQETLVHRKTGLMVEMEDSRALAEAIAFLLDNPDTAAQMGREGRVRALDLFSRQKYTDNYDQLYQSLLQESKNER